MSARRDGADDPWDTAGLEELVSGLWCEALELDEVGPSDNFFDLGGHSLLLHEVRDRLHTRLGTDVPLVDLFRYPTVRGLAAHLAASGRQGSAADPDRGRPVPGGRLAGLGPAPAARKAAPFADAARRDEEDEAW
ncbi:phosphopantetheine-binding protein [Streptomyces sp. WMMC905]|uniref:phosphopantetheine-binding protein n=1 Tax=Streptomyces sp. WMMC905 TaxID=3404123 RepID=UPI003B95AAAA